MGRPRTYATAAEKHRAYRARLAAETLRVDRKLWVALVARANSLAEAVTDARAAGCPVAAQIHGVATDTVLDALIEWFSQQAQHARGPNQETPAPGTPRARR